MFFNVAVLDFRIDIDPEIMKLGRFTAIKPPISRDEKADDIFQSIVFLLRISPKFNLWKIKQTNDTQLFYP